MKKIACVYSITNISSNKIYIGSTVNYKKRRRDHLSFLKRNKHKNKELQHDYNNSGIDNFRFDVLLEVDDLDDLRDLEDWYIRNYTNKDNSYNSREDAITPISFSLSKESIEKIRQSKLGSGNPLAKLTENQVREVKLLMQEGRSPTILAKKYGVKRGTLYAIKYNLAWSHIQI